MENLRVYDRGEEVFDRYTVLRMDWEYDRAGKMREAIGMSERPCHPQGFCQHCGATPGSHLGKRIEFTDLPEDCQKCAEHFTEE